MNIHEFQAKEIFKRFGVPVPRGEVARSAEETAAAAQRLSPPLVVKAQIHAGGRGKAGGVKLVEGAEAAKKIATDLLGRKLVTHQTSPEGQRIKQLLVEEALPIERELYLGMTMDRAKSRPALLASAQGGVDIEEVARRSPEAIVTETIDPTTGLLSFQGRKVAYELGLGHKQVNAFTQLSQRIYRVFMDLDCSLVEVNPLIVTKGGALLALDAKINLDNSALFRHADLAELRDVDEEDPREAEASQWGFSYIALEGNIGCMVNGAGLAMATMDIIKLYGGEPANFLDVGGGATKERVTQAFKILLADRRVEGVLVNIFGGIMRCDVIAQGIVEAAKEVSIRVPLVVRLQGTNVESGRKILAESGLMVTPAETMAEAAERVVQAVRAK
jgi:succinyl-CoA synthetase beta subunit